MKIMGISNLHLCPESDSMLITYAPFCKQHCCDSVCITHILCITVIWTGTRDVLRNVPPTVPQCFDFMISSRETLCQSGFNGKEIRCGSHLW